MGDVPPENNTNISDYVEGANPRDDNHTHINAGVIENVVFYVAPQVSAAAPPAEKVSEQDEAEVGATSSDGGIRRNKGGSKKQGSLWKKTKKVFKQIGNDTEADCKDGGSISRHGSFKRRNKEDPGTQTMNLSENDLCISALEAKAIQLFNKGEYGEAIHDFETLLRIKGNNPLTTRLAMVECYSLLGQRTKAKNTINDIKSLILSSDSKPKEIQELMESYKESHPFRAIVLRSCMREVPKEAMTANVVLIYIKDVCCLDIFATIKNMERGDMKKAALAIGVDLVMSILEERCKAMDVDCDTKVTMEAYCLNIVGASCQEVGEPGQAIYHFEKGVEVMQNHFGSDASKCLILGGLLHNIGVVNKEYGYTKKAEEFYLKSIEAKENSTNWSSEDRKEESLGRTRKYLQHIEKGSFE